MSKSKSKYYVYQQASLSQKVAHKEGTRILKKLSGSDSEISDSIAILSFLQDRNMIDNESAEFMIGLLDVLRLSHFATSEKTSEISKLGFMLPKSEDVISEFDENED